MFEGVVVNLLNKYLGRYIQNLDTDNLKIGIFDGNVELTDLQLRPEALYELDLPIEVKAGYVGKISVIIPWTSLYTLPVIARLEDVYVLAGPVTDRGYDPKKEKALENASKRQKLEELERQKVYSKVNEVQDNQSFVEKLSATIVNNIQVFIENIHIRYEDRVTNPDHPFACGLILKQLSAETTNEKWQVTQIDANSSTIHKLMQLNGLSAYWNPYLPEHSMVRAKVHTSAWRTLLKNSVESHRIMEEDFDFIIRPMYAKANVVINKVTSLNVAQMVAGFLLEEIDVLVSRQQFLNMLTLADSFQLMAVNQKYRKFSPGTPVRGHAKAWWKYAYNAIVDAYIRPYSWERIKAHRLKYNNYKNMYKKKLDHPEKESITSQLEKLEEDLDIANILLAREHAKLEFMNEAPDRAKKKKKEAEEKGWFSWMWSGGGEEDEDEEIEIEDEVKDDDWVARLTPEERDNLFQGIGYHEGEVEERSAQYVAHKLDIKLAACSLTLLNYGKEVLKVTLNNLTSTFENRPYGNGFKVGGKTESFVVEGVSVEHELVPLITSDIGVFAPSQISQVFNIEFEKNPLHVDADFAVSLNVQPVEIVYDEHSVSEIIAFFQVAHISMDDVKGMASDSLENFARVSRAGLQYAIEQHQTFHISVNMRSPYVVIPEFGTLHRGGNVVVIDFGKLKVESELQPKNLSLEEATMSEIESRLYDKFNITISEIKILLADSGDDWHTAQTQPESSYHILPSVGMNMAFFNSVKSDYKQLPQQKLVANLPTLKVELSNEKIVMLSNFSQNLPLPSSSSMMNMMDLDATDGLTDVPMPALDLHTVKIEPTVNDLRQMRKSVLRNSVPPESPPPKEEKVKDRRSTMSTDSDAFYSASDHSDDELDEWARTLEVLSVDDTSSNTNTINMLLRFMLGEVVIHISKASDKADTPYLMFRVNRLCADAALCVYGTAVQARLGGIEMVDKLHTGLSGEYLEMLTSKSQADLISIVYRNVDSKCPDFEACYHSVENGIVAKFSGLDIVFDRSAVLYLNTFVQELLNNMQKANMTKSMSTVISSPVSKAPSQQSYFTETIMSQMNTDDAVLPPGGTKLHMYAKMNNLNLRLCNKDYNFAELNVKGLETKLVVKSTRTIFHSHLSELSIEDASQSTLYPRILSIEDEKVFEMRVVQYKKPDNKRRIPPPKIPTVDMSVRMRLGRMQGVFLNKFINETMSYLQPIFNPELYESYSTAASAAVQKQLEDVQEEGTHISLNIDIKAPTILIPEHSRSSRLLVVELGDLSLKNKFEDTDIGNGVIQTWDHMYMYLDAVKVTRAKLALNGSYDLVHAVIEPINLRLNVMRALLPMRSELSFDISGKLQTIQINLGQEDLKVIMAVLRENMTEGPVIKLEDPTFAHTTDVKPSMSLPVITEETLDATTPVVEMHQPLLASPAVDIQEVKKTMTFSFVMEGMLLTLKSEPDNLMTLSPMEDDGDGLSRFEIGKIDLAGFMNNDKSLEVQIKLKSVSLDDIRPDSNLAIKRLIQSTVKKEQTVVGAPPMIDFKYKQSAEGNQHIDVVMGTIRFNICVPYLLTLANFFSSAMATTGAVEEVDANHNVDTPTTSPTVGPPASTIMTVSGRLKQPEIVLFAEPTEKNSRVLVMKTNCVFDYFNHLDKEHMVAKVNQLQIISCVYGKRNQTTSMVLCPCDVEFTRSVDPVAHSGVQMEAKLSDINLYASMRTIHIIMDVVDKLSSWENKPETPTETKDGTINDLWKTTKISSEMWLRDDPEDDSKTKYPIVPVVLPSERFLAHINKVEVIFEVENLDYHVPMLCVQTSLDMEVNDWSKQLRASAELKCQISFYNDKQDVWEPLLEPVMEVENNYRPWEVMIKLVQAHSFPIMSNPGNVSTEYSDDLDGDVHYLLAKSKMNKSESSETETDSETDMHVIRPKPNRKLRHGSDRSYDSMSHHSSIQGESDSDPEGFVNTISSTLDSIFSTDSSDADVSDMEDEAVDSSEKPVFLTAMGPIQVDSGELTLDEVDSEEQTQEVAPKLCNYIVFESRDKLLLNLTPYAMGVIKDVAETLMRESKSSLKHVHDLPGFEIHNQLGIGAKVTISQDLKEIDIDERTIVDLSKINRANSADVLASAELERFYSAEDLLHTDYDELSDANAHFVKVEREGEEIEIPSKTEMDELDGDETDGLNFLPKALAMAGNLAFNASAFIFDEEDSEHPHLNKKGLDKDKLHLRPHGFDGIYNISHRKDRKRLLPLTPCRNDTNYCILYDIDVTHGRKVIIIRSPMQLSNHLSIPVEVYCKTEELQRYSSNNVGEGQVGEFTRLVAMDPNSTYNVPLFVAYHCKLYVAPEHLGYQRTLNGVWWQDLSVAKDKRKMYTCLPKNGDKKDFYFEVVCEDGPGNRSTQGLPKIIPHYTLHLYPPVILHNYLPYDIHFTLQKNIPYTSLAHGENTSIYTINTQAGHKLTIQVSDYLGLDWMGSLEVSTEMEEFKAINMDPEQNAEASNKQLSLSIHASHKNALDLFVFSPYWLINKTGLPVQIRGTRSDAVFENNVNSDPLLFRYKKHRRKKAKLRVYSSKWTSSFSMDTVGSSGVVICNDKERNRKYQFLMQIQMSNLRLTKIVTIMPYFLVVNSLAVPLRYMEENEQADLWLDIAPQQCVPFWPVTDSLKLYVKYQDSNVCSQHIPISKPHSTVLRMDRGTALIAEVAGGTEASTTITFLPYEHGDCPVRIDNLCEDVFIKLHQKNQSQVSLLSPNESILYTWDDPTAERTLLWNVYNRKKPSFPAFITKDGYGEVPMSIQTVRRSSIMPEDNKLAESSPDDDSDYDTRSVTSMGSLLLKNTRTDKVVVYWVSFLDGLQRVLLLTQDERVAHKARKVNEAEKADMVLFLSLDGVSLSLINDRYMEVAYVSLNSAPAMWEVEVKHKWKTLNMELASWLEEQFYTEEPMAVLDDYIEANMEKMAMNKPFMGALRRTYRPAIWLQYSTSIHHTNIHLKIHRLQIDNQLPDAYFPSVLYPSPLPPYIVKKTGPKPFIEFRMIRRQVPQNNIDNMKFFKVLIQEFNIKLDKGFMLSTLDIFTNLQEAQEESMQLQQDLAVARRSLQEVAAVQAAARPQRIVFEYFHLSPLKMKISFSLDGTVHSASSDQSTSVTSDIIEFFLNSVGATLTEIKDVELRMAYFERTSGVMLTMSQILADVQAHYTSQFIQQAYVLLLGLDVLGNPYGLIKDFTQGFGDLFYEPFMGSMNGADKFADGLMRGVQSLLGHTVGGVAQSVSLITGSMGKALASLSCDADYKNKRRQRMLQQPRHLPHSLYLAGQGFVMGVALGLSGVVVKPVKGAHEEGAEGFFKGIGKGLLGLLTKPTGGVVDMVSMAFDGIRRAAEMGEDVIVRIRLPRYIHPELGLKPYSPYQAVGMRLLNNIEKGKYAKTDIYFAHAALRKEERSDVLLITDSRVLLLEKCRFWGDYDVEIDVVLEDILGIPAISDNKLIFKVRKDDSGFSIFTSDEREVKSDNDDILRWLQKKIDKAKILHAEGF